MISTRDVEGSNGGKADWGAAVQTRGQRIDKQEGRHNCQTLPPPRRMFQPLSIFCPTLPRSH